MRIVTCLIIAVLAVSCTSSHNWTGWRGAKRNATVDGFIAPRTWPETLTKVWETEVGIGDGSVLLVDGHLYIHVKQDSVEVACCLDANTSDEIWRSVLNIAPKMSGGPARNPGTRSTPAFHDGKIYMLGAGGILSCVDAESGKIIWQEKTYSEVPPFFSAASPLLIDDKCIVHIGFMIWFKEYNFTVRRQG